MPSASQGATYVPRTLAKCVEPWGQDPRTQTRKEGHTRSRTDELRRIADEIHLVLGILDQHLEAFVFFFFFVFFCLDACADQASVPAPMLHPHEVPGLSEEGSGPTGRHPITSVRRNSRIQASHILSLSR